MAASTPSIEQVYHRDNSLSSPLVSVVVENQNFAIHSDVICQARFFRAGLLGPFEEGTSLKFQMEDVEADTFATFANWLYQGHVLDASVSSGDVTSEKAEHFAGYLPLIKAYLFGDRIQQHDFTNDVIDRIALRSKTIVGNQVFYPGGFMTHLIFNNTLSGNALRRLVIDQHKSYGSKAWLRNEDCSKLHPEFLFELAIALLPVEGKVSSAASLAKDDLCVYHHHPDGRSCRGA